MEDLRSASSSAWEDADVADVWEEAKELQPSLQEGGLGNEGGLSGLISDSTGEPIKVIDIDKLKRPDSV